MEPLVTKTELLSRLEREYARLAAVLASLTAEQWTVRGGIGSWSVKDMLAHVIAHQERAREELRYAIRGERLEIDHSAVDAFRRIRWQWCWQRGTTPISSLCHWSRDSPRRTSRPPARWRRRWTTRLTAHWATTPMSTTPSIAPKSKPGCEVSATVGDEITAP